MAWRAGQGPAPGALTGPLAVPDDNKHYVGSIYGPAAVPGIDLPVFAPGSSQPNPGTQSSAAQAEFPWHAFTAIMATPFAGVPPGAPPLEDGGGPLTTAAPPAAMAACVKVGAHTRRSVALDCMHILNGTRHGDRLPWTACHAFHVILSPPPPLLVRACLQVEPGDAAPQQPRQPLRSARVRAARASTASADGADDTDDGPSTRTRSNAFDTASMDPRRAKRILANRQSAQRSRMKRLQHVHDLEARVAGLMGQVVLLQQRLEGEAVRAHEAAAAAQAAAAAAAARRAQLQQQEAAQRELRALVGALRRHAAAQGLHVPREAALALPPAAPPLPPHALGGGGTQAAAAAVADPHDHQQQRQQQQQEDEQQQRRQQLTAAETQVQIRQQHVQQQQPSAQPDLSAARLASPSPSARRAAAGAAVAPGFASPVDQMDGDFASLLGADVHAALFDGGSQEDGDLFGAGGLCGFARLQDPDCAPLASPGGLRRRMSL